MFHKNHKIFGNPDFSQNQVFDTTLSKGKKKPKKRFNNLYTKQNLLQYNVNRRFLLSSSKIRQDQSSGVTRLQKKLW